MAYREIEYPSDRKAFYELLAEQLTFYTQGAPGAVSALSNAAAVLGAAFTNINWIGFYLASGDQLVLGPFQGKPAVMAIRFGEGVCGAAWRERKAQVVHDVHCFVGHIACDCSSVSELVVPVFGPDGRVLGVIDIDSPLPGRFSDADAEGMADVAAILAPFMADLRLDTEPAGSSLAGIITTDADQSAIDPASPDPSGPAD